ncbi:MAG: GRRM system radical SAM/SPASM domain protein [Pseudanabaena sp.]|nr:MAG: GRRM system radical SAM/SPASM domain protein [Pseudanabaena sp.]
MKEESLIDFSGFGPIGLVVIQPTSFCNLDCDYCYLPDRQLKNQLDLDLLDPIFKTVFTSRFLVRDITILWHAGEPMALPMSFYESAFAKIADASQKYNTQQPVSYQYSFQTNGLFLNQAWCDFFKQHPVHVGVSIDGPAFIHDAHRKTRTGRGSHAGAMRAISLLQKNNIPFSSIAVITEESIDYPDEMFHFFLSNGITNVGFNMEETEGIHEASSLDRADVAERYQSFMKRVWDLTVQHEGALKVREFEAICGLVYTDTRLDNTDMNKPFVIVNFDYQGNFTTFDPELLSVKTDRYGEFKFGNVLHDTLESICATEKFQTVYQEMKGGVELCRTNCEYFGVCGGGAGSNKYWENGTFLSDETKACQYRIKTVTNIVLDSLEASFIN